MLKKIRVAVSLLFFTLITFYFVDFAGLLPNQFHVLLHIQIVPALLSLSVGIILFWLLVTFLFGRVYCSSVCPLGILQDIFAWVSKRINRKKKYKYRKPRKILRWTIVGICVVAYVFGLTILVSLLDPYSAFGRIATNILKPLYIAGNNLLTWIFYQFDNYRFYYLEVAVLSISAFVVAVVTLLVVGYLAYRYGRLYCNTVCPVGTLLGAVSKYALFKVRINSHNCTKCGKCSIKCKASCIDVKNKTVNNDRCVTCYNCLGTCNFNALNYSYARKKQPVKKQEQPDERKRAFLSTALLAAVALPEVAVKSVAKEWVPAEKIVPKTPLAPPGAQSIEHLLKHCTACHLCVSKCPSNILKPAFMEYGIGGIMQPLMSFKKGFCNFDCTVCSEVCPNGALLPLTKAQKHLTQVGKVVFVRKNCVVYTDETNCGACSEHCPTQAVMMVPYKDGLTIPKINRSICVGCGGCEFICPRPRLAIYVEGNGVHEQARPFKEAEKKEVELDGFGF